MRIPQTRAEAESAVEDGIREFDRKRGGVDCTPCDCISEFWPLARYVYSEKIERCPPIANNRESLTHSLTELAWRAVDAIVSPDHFDDLVGEPPHDEWWRFAPKGMKVLWPIDRTPVRKLLYRFLFEKELPYWVHRLSTQSTPNPQAQFRETGTTPSIQSEAPSPRGTGRPEASWEEIADEFEKLRRFGQQLGAMWSAFEGHDKYGISICGLTVQSLTNFAQVSLWPPPAPSRSLGCHQFRSLIRCSMIRNGRLTAA